MVTFRLSQIIAKKMIIQKETDESKDCGCIINLSSIADRLILPESFSYSICSASVNQLTKSLAVALADKGIRVNAIALGSIMSTTLKEMIREQRAKGRFMRPPKGWNALDAINYTSYFIACGIQPR